MFGFQFSKKNPDLNATNMYIVVLVFRAFLQWISGLCFPPEGEVPRIICSGREIIDKVPSLRLFKPLASGSEFHMVSSALRKFSKVSFDRREELMGGEIVLDWMNPSSTKGIVLLFHGLGGNSYGLASLSRRFVARGFATVVYNRRGHGKGSVLRGKFPEHACIEDAELVVDSLSWRGVPLYAVGVSAGANAMIRYMGEGSPILGAVSMCNALDLNATYRELEKRPMVDRMVSTWMTKLYKKHFGSVPRIRSMKEFDEFVTGKQLSDYYSEQASLDALRNIRVPVLCLGARNDVIVDQVICDLHDEVAFANPNVISVTTNDGGHVGWMTSDGSWAEIVAVEFIEAISC